LTQRLAAAEDACAKIRAKHEQKMRETQMMLDQLSEKVNLFENEEKFQELLQAQELVTQF